MEKRPPPPPPPSASQAKVVGVILTADCGLQKAGCARRQHLGFRRRRGNMSMSCSRREWSPTQDMHMLQPACIMCMRGGETHHGVMLTPSPLLWTPRPLAVACGACQAATVLPCGAHARRSPGQRPLHDDEQNCGPTRYWVASPPTGSSHLHLLSALIRKSPQ